jgi:hypothetical protein
MSSERYFNIFKISKDVFAISWRCLNDINPCLFLPVAVIKQWKNPPAPAPPIIPLPPILPPVPMDGIRPDSPLPGLDIDEKQALDGKEEPPSDATTDDEDERGDSDSSSDEEGDEKALLSNIQAELLQLFMAAASQGPASSVKTQPIYKDVSRKKNVCK